MQHARGSVDPASRWRRAAGRGVLVIAALACIATSRPGWHLEATAPAGAPTSTPEGGDQGLLITIAASAKPEVSCSLPDGRHLWLQPLAAPGPELRFLCPPGGRLAQVVLDGKSNARGCDKPTSPPGTFLQIVQLAVVPVWHTTAEASFAIEPWPHSATGAVVTVVIDAPGAVHVDAALAPGTDATAFGSVSSMGPTRDGKHYDFVMERLKGGIPAGSQLLVRATAFGLCEGACAPPGAVSILVASPE